MGKGGQVGGGGGECRVAWLYMFHLHILHRYLTCNDRLGYGNLYSQINR